MTSWDRQSGRLAVRDERTGTEQWGLGGTGALNQTLAPLLASSWGALPSSTVWGVRREGGHWARATAMSTVGGWVLPDHSLMGVLSWEG